MMLTKVRFWLGVLAAFALVGCAAPAPDVQPDEQLVSTQTATAPEKAMEASAQPTAEAAELAEAEYEEAKALAEAAAAEARARGTMTVSVPAPAGETTLLERIAGADAIVRAEFVSVTSVVDSFSVISGGEPQTPEFARGLAYTFNVLEYLKGSGGTQIVALALNSFERYPTQDEADAATDTYQADRDTQWDDREGILFLWDWDIGAPLSTKQTDRYTLGAIRGGPGWWDYYTIASKWNKRWLPSTTEGSDTMPSQRSAGEQTGTERAYLLDVPTGPGSPADQASAPTITLTALKAEVAKIAAEVAAGDGSAAYERCIYRKYSYLRKDAYHSAAIKAGLEPGELQVVYRFDIDSGLARDIRVNPEQAINFFAGTSGALEGDDAGLFEVSTPGMVNTLRPLPAGEYVFTYLERPPYLDICDVPIPESFKEWSQYMVGVTAPAQVIHEGFFDPVTVGTAVLADDTNGQLAPSSFGTTAISSISYESNEVTVTVDPVNGLSGRHLDFISLDGTLALSLEVSDAKKDNTDKTLTWPTTSDPWASGDTLMLRVYGATVDCSGTTTFGSCDQGPNFSASRFTFTIPEDSAPGETVGTVLATDPDSSDTVTHSLLSGNEAGHFTINASTGAITLASRLDYETDTSHKLRVMARSGNWGLALATVTVDVTDVDPDLVPAPTNLVVTEVADGFDATWDPVTGATRYDIQWKIDPHQYSDVFTDTTSAEIRPDGGVLCNTLYKFRVYAHGDGVDYDAIWGEVPPPLYLRTAACAESPS